MMQQGPPWFELGAEEIPFGPDQVNWTEIRNAAQGGGLYLEEVANGARILLGSDSLYLKETMGGEVQEFCLSTLDEPVVWIENQPDDVVYIKGYPGREGLGRPLMVGMQGSVYLMGPQVYAEGSGAMLGLLAVHGQGVIADDPDDNSGYDWSSPWDIETMEDFTFSCSMMLLSGEFRAERYWEPSPQVELDLYGGVQIDHWGFTCTQYSGYDADVVYDERLFDESPPWYPSYEVQGVAESGSGIAAERRLEASSNPFAGSVTVSLPWGRSCRISVFDTAGRLVETASATESWTWNAHGLPAGMYVVRATAAGETASAKLLLLR